MKTDIQNSKSLLNKVTVSEILNIACPIVLIAIFVFFLVLQNILPKIDPSFIILALILFFIYIAIITFISYRRIFNLVQTLLKKITIIRNDKDLTYILSQKKVKNYYSLVLGIFDHLIEVVVNQMNNTKELQQANEIIEKSSIVVFEWAIGPEAPAKFVTSNISMFGYKPEEFISQQMDYWDFVYKDDIEQTQKTVWEARKQNIDEYKHVYRVNCKNGDIRWVEEWVILERDAEGKPMSEKGIIRDITEQVEAEEKIQQLTYHDKLTGLFNRLYYDQALNYISEKNEHPVSIIIGDMNGLKLTNDAFGHKAGDDLLIQIAGIIQKVCRPKDIAARLSGDEFSIIMPNSGKDEAIKACEKIYQLCSEASNSLIQPSIALGYSTKTSEVQTLGEVIREAEDNMYRNKLNESKSIRSAIIFSLKTTLEKRTLETFEHSERIKKLAIQLGTAAGLAENKLDDLAIASTMHDIGKIGISDPILLKPDKLTPEEWAIIKKHPEIGYHIILSSPNMSNIAEYILAHHERWDGSGYPLGLKGEAIPIISRIIAIADAYDVMLSDRPYKNAMTKEEAQAEMRRCSGTQFDPHLVDIFLKII